MHTGRATSPNAAQHAPARASSTDKKAGPPLKVQASKTLLLEALITKANMVLVTRIPAIWGPVFRGPLLSLETAAPCFWRTHRQKQINVWIHIVSMKGKGNKSFWLDRCCKHIYAHLSLPLLLGDVALGILLMEPSRTLRNAAECFAQPGIWEPAVKNSPDPDYASFLVFRCEVPVLPSPTPPLSASTRQTAPASGRAAPAWRFARSSGPGGLEIQSCTSWSKPRGAHPYPEARTGLNREMCP